MDNRRELLVRAENLGKAYSVKPARLSDLGRKPVSVEDVSVSADSETEQTKNQGIPEESPLFKVPTRVVQFSKSSANSGNESRIWALKHFNFELCRGETVLLAGPNGSGKSTFLKILSKVLLPTEGSVELYGTVGSLLEVGAGLNPDLTGRENIHFYGAICGVSRHKLSSLESPVIEMADIRGWEDRSLRYYSSGMYARLAFSIVAQTCPEVLILDETLSVLDKDARSLVLQELQRRADSGLSNLLVAH